MAFLLGRGAGSWGSQIHSLPMSSCLLISVCLSPFPGVLVAITPGVQSWTEHARAEIRQDPSLLLHS